MNQYITTTQVDEYMLALQKIANKFSTLVNRLFIIHHKNKASIFQPQILDNNKNTTLIKFKVYRRSIYIPENKKNFYIEYNTLYLDSNVKKLSAVDTFVVDLYSEASTSFNLLVDDYIILVRNNVVIDEIQKYKQESKLDIQYLLFHENVQLKNIIQIRLNKFNEMYKKTNYYMEK